MKNRLFLLFFLPLIFLLLIPHLLYADIVSDFEQGLEDWTVSNNINPFPNAVGGNPGQHICAANPEFWIAPDKFRGDLSSYYDGRLLFSLRVEQNDNGDAVLDDIVLESAEGFKISFTIVSPGVFSTAGQPGANWTSYSIPLKETAGWRVIDAFGQPSTPPNQQQMQSVLGQLADLRIRGDYDSSTDIGCLDSVELRLSEPSIGTNVISNFNSGSESWAALDGGSNQFSDPSGGNPGGSICAANPTYWKAPSKFLGKMENFYGGRLLFNLKVSQNDNTVSNDVILEGPYNPANPNERLILAFEIQNPGLEWTSYSIPLHELAGWVKLVGGSPTVAPTRQELEAVLAQLIDLRIRGDYDFSTDTGCLDNVELRLPEPLTNNSVISRFDSDAESWAALDAGSSQTPFPSGGNPADGGHVCATNPTYWKAPAKFLGKMENFYGGRLLFNLKVSQNDNIVSNDVILEGPYNPENPNERLILAFEIQNSGLEWTSYSIPLHELAGWVKLVNGSPTAVPTRQELKAVLAQLIDLRIRGDYDFSTDTGCLDNVELRLPEPLTNSNVVSRFDSDAESWAALGDGDDQTPLQTGGNPANGGQVCATNPTYWKAPAEFLGKMENFYGGRLLFDLKVSDNDNSFPNDIILEGPYNPANLNERLILAFEISSPGLDWTSYSIPLNENDGGWVKVNAIGEQTTPPTQQEMREVLKLLVDLRIRGDYDLGTTTDCLDNVELRLTEQTLEHDIIVSPTANLHTIEEGGTATFRMVLSRPPDSDVTVGLSSSNASIGMVEPASFTFTSINWNIAQVATITGLPDASNSNDIPYQIFTAPAVSDDADYDGRDPDNVSVTSVNTIPLSTDVDIFVNGFTNGTGVTSENGDEAFFSISLKGIPTAEVQVPLEISKPAEASVSPNPVVFPLGIFSRLVTVTGLDDFEVDGDQEFLINIQPAISADERYNGIRNPTNLIATNLDNDVAEIIVGAISGNTREDGTQATFTVSLSVEPTDDVTIKLSTDDATEGTVSPDELVFTSTSSGPLQVTVIGQDDSELDGDQSFNIITLPATSMDSRFDGLNPSDVVVINEDDEAGNPDLIFQSNFE